MIIEKFESNKNDKLTGTLRLCSIGLIICAVIKCSTATAIQLTRLGWWLDTLILVAFPLFFFIKYKDKLTSRTKQFIEWTADAIVYKLKNDATPSIIQKDQIETVNINLDVIEITDKTNKKHLLDISDFDKYCDRIKIKDNFR